MSEGSQTPTKTSFVLSPVAALTILGVVIAIVWTLAVVAILIGVTG